MAYTVTARVSHIVARRDAVGWSTKDLAREMDMHPSTVFRILAGRVQPGPAFIAGACHVWGRSALDELFEYPEVEQHREVAA